MELALLLLAVLIAIEVTYLVYKSGIQLNARARGGVYVDTSALMDGRIVTAAQTGFIPGHLVIPRSVINEMQLLADQADAEKRSRARRGLDAVQELQELAHLKVDIIDDGMTGKGGVDERLIDLAKARRGSICTIDFNLNKAATAMGVRVLNINELAGSIRMAFLPGETMSLAMTQKGQSSTQAVGYLPDGTMVVVDKAASKMGQTVEIEFIRSLQTAAGRMMFAKLVSSKTDPEPARKDNKSFGRKLLAKPKIRNSAVVATTDPEVSEAITSTPSSAILEDKTTTSSANQPERRRRSSPRAPKGEVSTDARPESSNDTKDKADASQRSPRTNRRAPRKRKTNEDNLIELVNQQ